MIFFIIEIYMTVVRWNWSKCFRITNQNDNCVSLKTKMTNKSLGWRIKCLTNLLHYVPTCNLKKISYTCLCLWWYQRYILSVRGMSVQNPAMNIGKKPAKWAGHLAEKGSRVLAAERIRCDKLMPWTVRSFT